MSFNLTPSDINQTFIIESASMSGGTAIFSACTALYTSAIITCDGTTSILLSGGTSIFNGSISATTISGDTFFSGGTDLFTIIENVATSVIVSGSSFSGNTSGSCIGDLFISNLYGCSPITLHDDLVPTTDNNVNLGTPIKRFRAINTVSGTSTVWSSTTSVTTPKVDLGLDSGGFSRILTANSSVLNNDTLDGLIY